MCGRWSCIQVSLHPSYLMPWRNKAIRVTLKIKCIGNNLDSGGIKCQELAGACHILRFMVWSIVHYYTQYLHDTVCCDTR